MNSFSTLFLIVFFSVLVGAYANSLNRNGVIYFFISLFLSPLLVFIFLALVGKDENMQDAIDSSNVQSASLTNKKEVKYTLSEKYKIYIEIEDDNEWNELKNKLKENYLNKLPIVKNDDNFVFTICSEDRSSFVKARRMQTKALVESKGVSVINIFRKEKNHENKELDLDNLEKLEKLSNLLEKGYITKEEFEEQKRIIFGKI